MKVLATAASPGPTRTAAVGPRLGLHHVAYLRAVAQGIATAEAAMRYLGIAHRAQAVTAYRAELALAMAMHGVAAIPAGGCSASLFLT